MNYRLGRNEKAGPNTEGKEDLCGDEVGRGNELAMEEMTLEEYEKELEEKRKVLGADKDKKKEAVDKEEKGEEVMHAV
ncbi:hypothetical protein Tco_0228083 [Tanacetum coccineum]